jgi:hypothetical protein
MTRPHLLDALRDRVLLCDGAMGTRVQALTLDIEDDYWGRENCTDVLVLSRPDLIENGEVNKLMQEAATYLPNLMIIMQHVSTHTIGLRPAFEQIRTVNYKPGFDHCIVVGSRFVGDHAPIV